MNQRARPLALLLATLLAAAPAGCNREPAGETLLIAGSSTIHTYLEPVVEAFRLKHPRAVVVNEEGGSTAAVIALKRGAIGVATVGRDLTPDEDDLAVRNYQIARDAVAIVVNRQNPVSNIAPEKLAHVYGGELTSWKALGGDEAPITVLVRNKQDVEKKRRSTTRKSFDDVVLGGDEPTPEARVMGTAKELIEAVKRDPGAIGYVALHDASALPPEVKALTIDGVPMSRVTILSARYPLSRSYYLAVMRPTKFAEAFVTFTLSEEGQKILRDHGLVQVD